MKRLMTSGVVSACVLLIWASANAQMGRGMQIPTPQGIFNPVVGSGAQYNIQGKDGKATSMELAIVGKESWEGKDAYWYEVTADAQQQGSVTMKMLIVPNGNNSTVSKMIFQMPGRGPMEMDGMMGGRMSQNAQPKDLRDSAKNLGSESVTVPGGTFACDHWKSDDGETDVWVAKDVPPYGLVKMVDADGSTMVLTKVLTNVQDKITGTPMDMGQMMRGVGAPPQQ